MNNPNGGGIIPPPPTTPTPGDVLDPEVEELWSSRALLLVLLLLILSFWVSYYLKVRRIRSIHETIVALFSGMLVGALVRLAPGHVVQDMIAFKSTILLNVLLPPIILNSGYQLKQEHFFRHFHVILTFAFAGTFISAVALGVIVYLYSLLGLEGLSLTIVECLLFGSTLSATDPVTILAIFNQLHVDPKLYSVIFGESILNDAVAIVMFETLSQFHGEKIHVLSFFHGVGIFLLTFLCSMALGVLFGLGCSLMLKHSELGRYTEIESCLVFLIAYTSYFFSNALTMSGIVSLLFCGITLKHYAYHNMSPRTQRSSRYMFGSLASLSENFIFIYLGLSLFTQVQLVYKPLFILVTAVAMCIARYSAVFPISKLINFVSRARKGVRNTSRGAEEIPHSYQMVLFWAGLRGAVGVALAEGMRGEHAVALRTTVLVSVVLTVVVFGGTIGRMLEVVGIRTGVVDEDGDDETDEEEEYRLLENDLERRHTKKRSLALGTPGTSHHFSTLGGAGGGGAGPNSYPHSSSDSPFRDPAHDSRRARTGPTYSMKGSLPPSELSSDSEGEVLPSVSASASESGLGEGRAEAGGLGGVWSVLDEQYLLPVFSNATANRNASNRKSAMKAKRTSYNGSGGGGAADDSGDLASSGHSSPYGNEAVGAKSLSDVVSALVAPSHPSTSTSFPTPHLSYATPNSPFPSVDLTAGASGASPGRREGEE
ncbi:hypothetical protein B0A53_05955 [Rhodotorula sp. CCFEE 5036]|nr:hypothetical protein B0A53_05955 [Rhodotorula sp. CCFEE 5036]